MNQKIEIIEHGNIIELSLNRPQTFNAFDLEMVTMLANHLTRLATDTVVKRIVKG